METKRSSEGRRGRTWIRRKGGEAQKLGTNNLAKGEVNRIERVEERGNGG